MQSSMLKVGLTSLTALLLSACGDGGDSSGNSADNSQKATPSKDVVATSDHAVNLTIITDPSLRSCVEQTGVQRTSQLQILECTDGQISNLSGLQQFTQLAVLNLTNNAITDLTPLSPLTSLYSLTLTRNQIASLQPLNTLNGLRELGVAYNQLTSLDGIEGMTALTKLFTDNNQLQSLDPISDTQIHHLVAHNNPAPLPSDLPSSIQTFRI